jgi:hypothetical protein
MNPRVVAVRPNPDYTLLLTFANGEVRTFDVKPYLDFGIFRELRDLRYFNIRATVPGQHSVAKRPDFCPDTLYLDSVPVSALQRAAA